MKIVLLTASTGNGHTSAANAISEEAGKRNVVAPVIDAMDHCPKAFRKWFKNGYEMLVRRSPETWGYLYRASDKPYAEYWVQTFLDETCTGPLTKVLNNQRPQWVVCTHSLPQPRLHRLKKKYGFKVAVVVTDLYPHRMWLRGKPDLFFVPGTWTQDILAKRLPHSIGKTVVTGIPIAAAFANPIGREAARKELGIPLDKKFVLLTSGGIGGGEIVQAAQALAEAGVNQEVVCGRHHVNEGKLRDLNLPNATVYGQVPQDKMALLMQACDLMVAKAGGLTTCEALSTGCPFVIHMPLLIPGQEEGNADFLAAIGAGVKTHNSDELVAQVMSLLADPAKLQAMSAAGKKHAQPQAAQMIVTELENRSKSRP